MDDIVGIVILYNFNEEVIKNIKTYNNLCKEVLAIDNSDIKNEKLIKKLKEIENIKYISLEKNLGIAKALNIGIDYANNSQYKWALTMDQDSKFSTNLIKEYFDEMKLLDVNKIAIFSPNYFFDRKKNKKYEGHKFLEYTMQSGNLVNLDIYNELGPFKEDFFIDGVDYEYCIRANNNGYKVVECGNAILEHTPAITKKVLFLKYGYCSSTRIYYQIRNLLWISKKYNNKKMKFIVLYKIFKIIFLFDNKKEYIKMCRLAKKDFKNNRFGKLEQ